MRMSNEDEGRKEGEGEWRRGGGKKVVLESTSLALCYYLFPGRPDKAGAKIDNNCCRSFACSIKVTLQSQLWSSSELVAYSSCPG